MDDIERHARRMRGRNSETFSDRAAHEAVPIIHAASDAPGQDTEANDAEETFVLAYQRTTSASDIWIEGKRHPATFERGTFAMIDLRESIVSRIHTPFDALHFVIPKSVIENIASPTGRSWAGRMTAGTQSGVIDAVAEGLMTCLFASLAGPGPTNRLMVDHLVLAMQVHFARTYGGMSPNLPAPRMLESSQVRTIKDLLANGSDYGVSLASLASEVGMSRRTFAAGFRATTGYTPQAWQARYRILTAKSLLQDGSLPLVEVAIRCGFADQSHFTRVFKRATDFTPGAWRAARNPREPDETGS